MESEKAKSTCSDQLRNQTQWYTHKVKGSESKSTS